MFCEAGEMGERADVSWRVLPVVYDEAALRLQEAIDELKPRVVISVGICDEPCYRIERVAHNLAQHAADSVALLMFSSNNC